MSDLPPQVIALAGLCAFIAVTWTTIVIVNAVCDKYNRRWLRQRVRKIVRKIRQPSHNRA